MWRNHPFRQRNKAIEKAVGGGDRRLEGRQGGQNLKKGGWAMQGDLHKIGGQDPSANYVNLFVLLFVATQCLVVAVQPCME